MTPAVSVLMPVRNGDAWLRAAIDSVLAQDLRDFELLVVDDGSTDDTPRIVRTLAHADPRVRPLDAGGRGLVAALNHGLAEARAAVIARLDADDRATPQRLSRQLAFLRAHPEVALAGTWAEKIDGSGAAIGRLTPETRSDKLKALLARTNPFVHSSVMMRTELVRRLGGYRAAFEAAEDYDLWLRIAERAELANLPQILTLYRWHPANVSRRKELRQCFSIRLAQRSAAGRTRDGRDPADGLAAPPDWRSPASEGTFFAADARLYRLLDPLPAEPGGSEADPDVTPLIEAYARLTHKERKLAQRALLALVSRTGGRDRRRSLRLLRLVVALHPARALPLAWTWLTQR